MASQVKVTGLRATATARHGNDLGCGVTRRPRAASASNLRCRYASGGQANPTSSKWRPLTGIGLANVCYPRAVPLACPPSSANVRETLKNAARALIDETAISRNKCFAKVRLRHPRTAEVSIKQRDPEPIRKVFAPPSRTSGRITTSHDGLGCKSELVAGGLRPPRELDVGAAEGKFFVPTQFASYRGPNRAVSTWHIDAKAEGYREAIGRVVGNPLWGVVIERFQRKGACNKISIRCRSAPCSRATAVWQHRPRRRRRAGRRARPPHQCCAASFRPLFWKRQQCSVRGIDE